jgi:alpha-ribazole phosphatase
MNSPTTPTLEGRLPHRLDQLTKPRGSGRWLASWGWSHHVDARLIELDFGAWVGQGWTQIGA